MDVPGLANYACPLPPSDVCFVGQFSEDRQKTHINVFDPVTGKRREVRTVGIHPGVNNNWMPSPDASRIVFSEFNRLEGRIRLFSLQGDPDRDIVVKGWAGFNAVNWAPDGKSFFVSSQSPTSSTLLHVDLDGHATPLWDQRGGLANLRGPRAERARTRHRRYYKRQQRLDDRKFLKIHLLEPPDRRNVTVSKSPNCNAIRAVRLA